MREILFKAKRIDNGEWVEGYFVENRKIHTKFHSVIFTNIDSEIPECFDFYEIDENTLCQYTGLTDKNGNKIWENDVVVIQHYATKAHKVKWGYGGFYVGINGFLCRYNTVCEVIGNIFGKPELLKEGAENE